MHSLHVKRRDVETDQWQQDALMKVTTNGELEGNNATVFRAVARAKESDEYRPFSTLCRRGSSGSERSNDVQTDQSPSVGHGGPNPIAPLASVALSLHADGSMHLCFFASRISLLPGWLRYSGEPA